MNKAAAAVDQLGIALPVIAVLILQRNVPDRMPVSNVAPFQISHDGCHVVRLLHNCVVDRDGFSRCKGRGIETHNRACGTIRQSTPAGHEDVRCQLCKGCNYCGRAEHEHAAVPGITALGKKSTGIFGIRFFDKRLDPVLGAVNVDGSSQLEIAIASCSMGWCYPKGDKQSLAGKISSTGYGQGQRTYIRNHVVGRQDQHWLIAAVRQVYCECSRADGGRSVASLGLE